MKVSLIPALFALATLAHAGTVKVGNGGVVKVGNGDDGSDLEGFEKIEKGVLVETRQMALDRVEKLNVAGIRGLGDLAPEIERTPLYRAKKDVQALPEDQGTFHTDFQGRVYARTFARPHAATRFFPVVESLDRNQLVALHVHEGLHRALPESIRENEAIVSRLTLAITTPDATHDQVADVAKSVIPPEPVALPAAPAPEAFTPHPLIARPEPSQTGYKVRQFLGTPKNTAYFPEYERIHIVHSYLYPFGDDDAPVGMGLEASIIERKSGGPILGPLGISGRTRLWSKRNFEIDGTLRASLNTLSSDELVNSAYGRDVWTVGLAMRKIFNPVYVENFIDYSFASMSKRRIGNTNYQFDYGSVIHPKFRFGAVLGDVQAGVFLDMHLADELKLKGGDFNEGPVGRYRIVTGGPEITWTIGHLIVSGTGRFLIDATQDTDLSYLGNPADGIGKGSVELSLGYQF